MSLARSADTPIMPEAQRIAAPTPAPRHAVPLVRVAAAGAAVAFGLAIALNPVMGLALFIGAAALWGFTRNATFAVCAFTAATYFEIVTAYTGSTALSPVKWAGGALIVVALTTLLLGARAGVRGVRPTWRSHPATMGALVAFLLVAIASAGWAEDLSQVRSLGMRLTTIVLVFLAIGTLLQRPSQLVVLAWAALAAATASTLAGFAIGADMLGRAIGTFTDPNDFAAALVPAMMIGYAAVEATPDRWKRGIGLVALAVCGYGLLLTQSRGGLVAFIAGAAILLVTARGRELMRLSSLSFLAVAAALCYMTFSSAGQGLADRFTSSDSSGRTDLWKVAVNEFAANPIGGVGLGNYPVVSVRYIDEDVHNTDLFVSAPRTTHNTPLELLAELGVVGFACFYGFVGGCLLAMRRGLQRARQLGDPQAAVLARGFMAATVGALATGIFLSGQYQSTLWIMLAAGLSLSVLLARQLQARHQARAISEASATAAEGSARRCA